MGGATDPVYLRVLDDLRTQIRDGALAPGARVPSRNGIIARYGIGETAAKHVLAVLAAEGLIEARPGSGSYVRMVPPPCHLEHDRPHFPGSPFGLPGTRPATSSVNRHGQHTAPGAALAGHGPAQAGHQPPPGAPAPSAVVAWEHQTEQVPAPRQIGRRLRLAAGELVTRTRYLLTADGSPVQLAVSYEPHLVNGQAVVPLPEEGPFAGRGVIERMREAGLEVDEVVEDISVRASAAEESALLRIPPGAAVLVVEREHRAGGRVVETADIVVAADRYRLRYRMRVTGSPDAQPTVAA
jgi:DNA-binding GntR family transcriptional regulator